MKTLLLSILFLIPSLMMGQTYKMYSTKNYHNYNRENETYNFSKRNVQFPRFFALAK